MKVDLYGLFIDFLIRNKKINKKNKIDIEDVDNILMMSNTAIGDTVFNTPAFRSLKQFYPNKKLIVLLNPTNYKLFETNKYIDEIVTYDGRWRNFFNALRILKTKKIDLTFILHSNEPQATPLAVLSGSKYIIKIPNDKNKYNNYHTNLPTKEMEDKHGIFDRLKQLEYININDNNPTTELYLKHEWNDVIDNDFSKNNIVKKNDILIGFQIGASTVSRMWFEERWIELANVLLNKNDKIKIILTGAPNEKKLTSQIVNKVNSDRIFDYAGKFCLEEAACLIDKLDLLITPDTGPMHIAAALKVPTIGFFIAAKWYGSNPCHDTDIHLYIQKNTTCSPCIGKRCKYQECMWQITVDDVAKKMKELNRGII